ncbi:P-loop containing nucleoside triphosphate hydrolase protein [Periconia macrospinosa]|uniref:P-loop containing nucleoside triphosphate hydrolase protein n=1 Tax=Periconia macrospinosa TaxID=97972 RepID=A0A2V1D8T5_9PLEO|nr:P-loop containing nucleoside triphosphate hydrolase protein [Periconia macrospinosa]
MPTTATSLTRAWKSATNGPLFAHIHIQPRIPTATRIGVTSPASIILPQRSFTSLPASPSSTTALLTRASAGTTRRNVWNIHQQSLIRPFSTTRAFYEAQKNDAKQPARVRKSYKQEMQEKGAIDLEEHDGVPEDMGFAKSEKANAAAQVNLSAKLSKDGVSGKKTGGAAEMWRLIKIARPEAKTLSWAFVFLLMSSAVSMSIPFSIGKILDIATQPEGTKELLFGLDITTFYIGLAGVLATGAACNFGRIIILRIVGERIVARLRSQLYRKTFIQNAEFFDANRVGDLISRLGSDTIIVGKSITQNLSDGLRSIVSGAAGFAMMGWVSIKLTGILAIIGPPVAIVAFVAGRQLRNLSRKIQKNLGTLTKVAEERLGNVRTAQAFAAEVQEVGRYNRQIKRIFALGKKEALVAASFYGSTGLMGNLTVIAVLYVGGGMVKNGTITIGELSSFLMYTAYAGSSMVGLSGFWGEMMKGVGAASRLFELQDRHPTISPTKGEPVRSARGPIEFKNVSFSYPTRPAVKIFKNLNFTIEQGTNVAIVAPSGAGKSTVASMLLRFYVPTEGTITINGRDITTLNAKQLRRKIGFVGQEPVLFSGTIAENIAYGVPNATRAEIIAAARKANCEFIGDFPDGLETHVGARGTQLSGGQKQRIAIARALIKKPDILILDEATSALDAESETLVNQALGKLLREKNTTISIAHRLSTIKRSDRIICISADGQVAEEGTYEELSSNPDGAFSKLMEWQLSGGEGPKQVSRKPTEEEEIERELEMENELDRESEVEQEEEEKARLR